ncbi:MAG: hypothetical protein AB7U05_11530 [Mangrovibacterium sp.]
MKLDELVAIYRGCGYSVSNTDGQYFLNRGCINYSFPHLSDVSLNPKIIRKLKWRYLISVIKVSSPIKNTHEFIIKTKEYRIDMLPHRTRPTTRKSLRECGFRVPTIDDLLREGLYINRQTMKLQHRDDKYLTNENQWKSYVTSFYGHEDVAMLGAYYAGKMIGYIIAFKTDGKYHVVNQYVDRNWPGLAPLNGLIYTLFNKIIEEEGELVFSDGMESFSPLPELNRFKRTMLFEPVPATRVYILHPVLRVSLGMVILFYVKMLRKRSVRSKFIQKIIRLYQGQRILDRITAQN